MGFIYIIPFLANANIVSDISTLFSGNSQVVAPDDSQTPDDSNSQNVPLLASSVNLNANAAVGGGNITVSDDGEALMSESGPSGTIADIGDTVNTGQISKYTVRAGDNLSSIAKMYGVTPNTIVWANNLSGANIHTGESLLILPVSGTIHTVAKGDTLASIAKKYNADVGDIAQFNGLDSKAPLVVGNTLIIPNGEGSVEISGSVTTNSSNPFAAGGAYYNPYRGGSGPNEDSYYVRPLAGGIMTQGLHGYNAVDIGTPIGTPIYAAATGQVIVARSSGWNGGYGNYIVISHDNGTQTLYAHLSQVLVSEGGSVAQGQTIGLSGNTGDVFPAPTAAHPNSGAHLHFEVRGAHNFMLNKSEY